jgi:hypothetical protein
MSAMTSGPGFRLARSAIFAAVCVATTALGHALMSGASLPGWAVGYAFAGVTSGAWWLTGRERGALVVTGATVATQGVLHSLFVLSHLVTGPSGTATGMSGMSGMQGMAGMTGMDAGHSAAALGSTGRTWTLGMFLAHLLAALVCALWLWRGEAAAYRLGRALAAFVCAPLRLALRALAPAALPAPPRSRAASGPVRALRGSPLRHVVIRRGPPPLPAWC